ncbi:neuromedin-U receptor 2-like [Ylistrum balloti]|uniref:neuromedin-U receptor 2-like n=1 Tax=Ylistrum balloti TaxID=509963 RepID=UPI002905F5A1|nr:neuromedin-U receptor 2-like [Ylistrum balloti]
MNITVNATGNISFVSNGGHAGPCVTSGCRAVAVIISLIAIPGAVANALVCVRVCADPRLRTPTFTALAALAFADFLFILLKYNSVVVLHFFYDGFTNAPLYLLVMDSLATICGASSAYHVVLLYSFRYFKLVYPLKGYLWFTAKKILAISGGVWLGCGIFISAYIVTVYLMAASHPVLAFVFNIITTIVMALFPLLIILILHFMKTAKLRYSIAATRADVTRIMSRMVTAIVIVYIITTTPANIRDIVSLGFHPMDSPSFHVFEEVCRVLMFVNFAANPFIYLLFSSQFRQSVVSCIIW